jgi:hypothetical protein
MALLLLVTVVVVSPSAGRSHWLLPHGRIACDGKAMKGATLYRSRQGDVFAWMPNSNGGTPAVSLSYHWLLRCNTNAFTRIVGLLYSREADASSECAEMWKGAGSGDRIPPHVVTDSYAEFPWHNCATQR